MAPTYDLISVRASGDDGGSTWIMPRPDGLSVKNSTLWQLIFAAYDPPTDDHPAGLPGWAFSSKFNVEAKMDDLAFAKFQKLSQSDQQKRRQLMLQLLLAERFQLKVHHESKERPIYALVIAGSGSKLKPVSPVGSGMSGKGRIEYSGAPIGVFAESLSSEVSRPVIDKTGLTGTYDFKLSFVPDELQGSADDRPSIFTALEQQLGLKLESTKGSVDVLVVDHVEHPSEN